MKLEGVLTFARSLLKKAVSEGDIAVDCTIGNGHDTLFLSQLVGSTGTVYGFDVQHAAIENTTARLQENGVLDRVSLHLTGHQFIMDVIPNKYVGKVTGAIFNLGYLPGSDKTIVTKPETTIAAIDQLLEIMAPKGIIIVVIYHGHDAGAIERDLLLDYAVQLDQKKTHVLQYQFINQKNNPPFIIAIEKK